MQITPNIKSYILGPVSDRFRRLFLRLSIYTIRTSFARLCDAIKMFFAIEIYRTAQNFDGRNIYEFDEFPAIRQYFPYQNFPFI